MKILRDMHRAECIFCGFGVAPETDTYVIREAKGRAGFAICKTHLTELRDVFQAALPIETI